MRFSEASRPANAHPMTFRSSKRSLIRPRRCWAISSQASSLVARLATFLSRNLPPGAGADEVACVGAGEVEVVNTTRLNLHLPPKASPIRPISGVVLPHADGMAAPSAHAHPLGVVIGKISISATIARLGS